jgi:alpha-mannosidase
MRDACCRPPCRDLAHCLPPWTLHLVAGILVALSAAPRCTAAEPGGARVREAGAEKVPGVEQVIITFKTHFDIGYTDMAAKVVERYRTGMIDQALEVCDRSRDLPRDRQFVWMIPGWPMKKILEDWDGQTAERKDRVLQAFKEGRFAVHALPFTTHTELLDIEDLVRGLGFASRLSRSLGLDLPRDAKMTDVPCHTWFMPTMLEHAGVDFLHLGCNAASRSPEVPALFWWEGPDGSRVLTMYTAESYGTGLLPPKGWPSKTWLALVHTGDNHGPPRPDEVKKLLEEAREKLPGMKVRIGRLSDFADAILAEKPDLPVVRGDMPDTWIHGPMCDPAGARTARNVRPAIAACESLHTMLRCWGVEAAEVAPTIASAYEQSLLYGEHTWGGALYWVASYSKERALDYGEAWKKERAEGRFRRLEESWAEHTSYIETAEKLIRPALEAGLQSLARAVKAEGPRIVVFNPLPWRRDGVVILPGGRALGGGASGGAASEGGASFRALKPVDDGAGGDAAEVPVGSDGTSRWFLAREVPPLGYRTYVPVAGDSRPVFPGADALGADPQAGTMENRFLKATLDPGRGTVRSLIDKRSGRELVDASAPQGFGQYLYERFDASQVRAFVRAYVKIDAAWAINELGKPDLPPPEEAPYRAASPSGFKLRLEKSGASVVAVMEAPAGAGVPHAVTTKIALHADQPYLELEVTLHGKPADPWPEAGWICLPASAERPEFRLGRLGSIVNPARDIVPGSNRHLLGITTGLTITDAAGRGAGICPLDHPLVSLGEPGCWKYSRDFVPARPAAYVNLFNNQWTTNFRLWNEGTWSSRVRVWAVDGHDGDSGLITPSLEARFPLLAVTADGTAGKLPASQAGLEVSRKGLLVTALGANPDGEGTLLRLWELSGRPGKVAVKLPPGMGVKAAQGVDLRGRPRGEPIKVAGDREKLPDGTSKAPSLDRITVEIDAFAPASCVLR